jgi:hypothetical protein
VRSVTYPGTREIGHAWAYLPDLAETIVRLAAIEQELDKTANWQRPFIRINRINVTLR